MEQKKIEEVIINAVNDLKKYDFELIKLDNKSKILEYDKFKEIYERKLHEVCINHRLAVYLEKYVNDNNFHYYNVDIEYNRYYKNQKHVETGLYQGIVRPDIIIHKRVKHSNIQHLLVIEAKKTINDSDDEKKIKSLMEDHHYNYKYGAKIIYNNLDNLKIDFFYHGKDKIETKILF